MELDEIRRNILTPTVCEENQKINDKNRYKMKMEPKWSPMRQVCVFVETEITDEERIITDELKVFLIRNETEQYLLFKK